MSGLGTQSSSNEHAHFKRNARCYELYNDLQETCRPAGVQVPELKAG